MQPVGSTSELCTLYWYTARPSEEKEKRKAQNMKEKQVACIARVKASEQKTTDHE